MDKAARLRQARKASKISSILFWGQFKRSVVNVSEQVERDRALGVSNPNTPVWTRERIEPSISEAAMAGEKIVAVENAIASTKTPQLESKPEPPSPDPWIDDRLIDRTLEQASL